MKYMLLLSLLLCTRAGFSQEYFFYYEDQSNKDIIKVRIDTASIFEGVLVERKHLTEREPASIEMTHYNALVLLGDFETKDESLILDYSKYNFFFIPFESNTPFFSLNAIRSGSNQEDGLFHIRQCSKDVNNLDIIFGYRCDDIEGNNKECVCKIRDNRVIECINVANECETSNKKCSVASTIGAWSFDSGGILIKVSAEKSKLLHNIAAK